MRAKHTILAAGISGALAVMIGAFGAHGLKDMLTESGRMATFETAVKYQFFHTLALFMLGLLMLRVPSKVFSYAVIAMLAGIFIFSGSLYILCVTGITFLGAITPIGGLAFIAGWLLLSAGVVKNLKD